jgi:hypothetical protein
MFFNSFGPEDAAGHVCSACLGDGIELDHHTYYREPEPLKP